MLVSLSYVRHVHANQVKRNWLPGLAAQVFSGANGRGVRQLWPVPFHLDSLDAFTCRGSDVIVAFIPAFVFMNMSLHIRLHTQKKRRSFG